HRKGQRLCDDNQQEDRPIQEVRENRPGVGLHEMVTELVQMSIYVVERSSFQDALQMKRLVRDQVAERHPEAWNWRLVEGDHGIPEGPEQEQLGKLEHLLTESIARKHHPQSLPADRDRRQFQASGC